MIYTFKITNTSEMSTASQVAELMKIPFTQMSHETFTIVVNEEWIANYFHSKIGHAEILSVGGGM